MTRTTPAEPRAATDDSFALRLRRSTWGAHGQAESAGAMTEILGGGTRAVYETLLTQLYFVYTELEAAVQTMRADAVAAPFAAPELDRLPSLERDLATLRGADWRERAAALPETERYVQRLREVAHDWSGTFVAHHYTRYLGDLSGGFDVGAAAERHLGIGPDNGGSFYVFAEIANPNEFKVGYRALLEQAPWTRAEQDRIIAETLQAYRLNTDLQVAVAGAARAESEQETA